MNRKEFDIPRLPSLDELIKRAEKEQKEDSCEKKRGFREASRNADIEKQTRVIKKSRN